MSIGTLLVMHFIALALMTVGLAGLLLIGFAVSDIVLARWFNREVDGGRQ